MTDKYNSIRCPYNNIFINISIVNILLNLNDFNRKQSMTKHITKNQEIILVIDDNVFHREIAKLLLKKMSYKVITAASGEEGLKYVSTHLNKVALILLDINMPGMDGLEFLSIMKADSSLSKISIILQTGATDDEIQRGLIMGANGYVQKPYTRAELYAAINKLNIKG